MKHILSIIAALLIAAPSVAQRVQVQNPYMWTDTPDPDIIRVGEYYYLVTTTMHYFPGAPVMRSTDLVHWHTVSYLFDEIHDTPRYDMNGGTVYGRGQWATSLRYHNGTFWALFTPNDEPHRSLLFRTADPAEGWTLHSRLPAYHDPSLFFDDDGRIYVFSGSGDIHLAELDSTLTAERQGGTRTTLTLHGKPAGLHEGSRVVKHDGMYYLLCVSWPHTGRQQIAYRSRNIEGPYESKIILKSDFGGFPLAGQGTIVDGKHGEWYGIMFQDRTAVGRVLTIEPCSWIDGWPMLGNVSDGKIPDTMSLYGDCPCHQEAHHATIDKDYQWNHNFIRSDISTQTGSLTMPGEWVRLRTSTLATSIYDARNTLTWRTWGAICADTIAIDARRMHDGDCAGLAAFNGDSGILTLRREGKRTFLTFSEESVRLSNHTKAITDVEQRETERIEIPTSRLKDIRLAMQADFNPRRDIATFAYSIDGGKTFRRIGTDYRMIFDYTRFFTGTRYAAFYYSTKTTGGEVEIRLF